MELLMQDLTENQKRKTNQDLQLISHMTKLGKDLKCRVIIAGGYAIDGALGQITRYHNDIDIQVYCENSDGLVFTKTLLEAVAKKDLQFSDYSIEDKDHKEYYRNLYVKIGEGIADIYYLQTKSNPFDKDKVLIKKDGSLTEPHLYETRVVNLNNIIFEAQDPLVEAADKIYKREHRGDPKRERDEQDISNLKQIVSSEDIAKKIGRS